MHQGSATPQEVLPQEQPIRALARTLPEIDLEAHAVETAAQHLVQRIPLAHPRDTVAEVLARLPGESFDSADAVYVVDDAGRLQGVLRLPDLLRTPGERLLREAMTARPPTVHPNEDQEKLALTAVRHGLAAVPVTDEEGRLVGVVPAEALIDILRREHVEDLHRLAGIMHEADHVHAPLEAAPWRRLRLRLPWLLVGLAGSVAATLLMAGFEQVLERRLVIAFFIPAIVYLADAIGTQTEAIAIRYLSFGHAPLSRLLLGEVATGFLIGLCLGALVFPLVLLGFGDVGLATAVTLAVIAAGTCATSVGLLLPWVLSWAGKDPAMGSGPVATVIQDVLSLVIYLLAVTVLL